MPVYVKMKKNNKKIREKHQLYCVRIKFENCQVRKASGLLTSFIKTDFNLNILYCYEDFLKNIL